MEHFFDVSGNGNSISAEAEEDLDELVDELGAFVNVLVESVAAVRSCSGVHDDAQLGGDFAHVDDCHMRDIVSWIGVGLFGVDGLDEVGE